MKVLIGCERSGVVRDAFTKRGFDAWSCDTEPTDQPGNHYQCDIMDVLGLEWSAVIAFPPCTHLSGAGAPSWPIKKKDGRQKEAFDFVLKIYNCGSNMVAIENPTGFLNSNWRKPDQIINPFQFGDPFKKRTCLWLKNLPKLNPTKIVKPEFHFTSNSTRGGLLKDGTRKKSALPIRKAWDSGQERSVSFQGIADAMAQQWGDFILKPKGTMFYFGVQQKLFSV